LSLAAHEAVSAKVAELNETLLARATHKGLNVVVNIEVVDQVTDLGEGGLAFLVLAQHQLVDTVALGVDFLQFVVLT
jgi:hypothetical protein